MAQLFYAGFPISDRGACNLTWGRTLQADAAGRPVGYSVTVSVNAASIACAGAADAATKMAALTQVLSVYGGDLVFDGGRAVRSSQTLGGVRCTAGPVWLPEPGGSGVTFISYSCQFAWEYLDPRASNLVDFQETVTVRGGEPRRVGRDILNGPPLVQTTVPVQHWRATQAGRAVGLVRRPTPADPLYPAALTDKTFTATSARRVGDALRDFGVTWSYEFVSAVALTAAPTEWLG